MKKNKLEKEEVVHETESEAQIEITEESKVEIDPMKLALARIETLEKALSEAELEKLKALAEAQNMKKRVLADYEQRAKYMFKAAALELVNVYENLSRANEQAQDFETLKKGLEMTLNGFNNVLQKEGVSKIEALHQPYNPDLHQALVVEESDAFASDMVIEVFQEGYMLKDRLLRASMVKVSKAKEEN